jgi:hypothetical protein
MLYVTQWMGWMVHGARNVYQHSQLGSLSAFRQRDKIKRQRIYGDLPLDSSNFECTLSLEVWNCLVRFPRNWSRSSTEQRRSGPISFPLIPTELGTLESVAVGSDALSV